MSRFISLLAAILFIGAGTAQAASSAAMLGGPNGTVHDSKGTALEGMMVQLISDKSAIRTTVYSHADGRYEFPKLAAGSYVLRIALPRDYRPYVKQSVAINGATKLADIVMQPAGENGALPATPDILAQLSGAELLAMLPGTPEQKQLVNNNCSYCHSFQQILRNRYDADSWRKIVFRMMHGGGATLININPRGRLTDAEENLVVSWLTEVRGPDSKELSPAFFARPAGRSTNAIITEYELPRLELATHDVAGDGKGSVWYSTHRSSYIGRLDPKTGHIKEYYIPMTPDAAPGTHWIFSDPKGNIWASANWSHQMVKLDPATGAVKKVNWYAVDTPINNPNGGNYAFRDGFIWQCRDNKVMKANAETGAVVQSWPTKKYRQTYGSALSPDGRYFGGGTWPADGMVILDTKTGEVFEPETSKNSQPARGSFDIHGNYWSGGRGGILTEYDTAKHEVHEYKVPTAFGGLYTAKADKNGEVWTGGLQTGHYFRFNPKTQQWTDYMLPEPYGHDRESWIDNSTTPVSVWYVDHDGWLTRIQPLE